MQSTVIPVRTGSGMCKPSTRIMMTQQEIKAAKAGHPICNLHVCCCGHTWKQPYVVWRVLGRTSS